MPLFVKVIMVKALSFPFFLSIAVMHGSCSQGSGSGFFGSPNTVAKPAQTSAAAEGASVQPAPAAKRSPEPEATAQPEPEKSQECWFAVSGTYVGLGDYEDTFPKTKSGNKISSGELFDTVGGVFLAARPEPYVYGEGGKEIDKAVDFTFDGIVVPPGMSVEIRPAANAEPIHSGEGPLIAIAGRSEGVGYGSQTTFKEKYETGGLKHWPQWMQDYLKNSGGQVKIIDTHPGRWVKVSVVDGGRCTGADK